MNTNNQMVMVPAGKLKPHPKNPRKDLGDLTELSEIACKQRRQDSRADSKAEEGERVDGQVI